MSTTIRVSQATKSRIADLARVMGTRQTEVVDAAVEALERQTFFDSLNSRFEQLREDPAAWAEIEAERRAEEEVLADDSPE
ncbi:MAG: hypothetical protein ACR2FO_00720 [Actinomycetota bacterium]